MLDPLVVRVTSGLMFAGFLVAIVWLRRLGPVGGLGRVRAQDNPPDALQTAWLLMNFVPNLYPAAVLLAPDWSYGTFLHFSFPFDGLFQVWGLALWSAGGLLAMWAGRTLGRFMVIEIVVTEGHRLVTEGPYARIRHPTYAAVIFLAFGLAAFYLSYVLLAVAVAVVAVANYRATKEERLLSSPEGFGDAYRAYMARTGRFLPWSLRTRSRAPRAPR